MRPDLECLLKNYGTAVSPHSGRSLRDHLIGTFNLLKAWGNDQDVCLAGLFHSIYGTEVFTRVSAVLAERGTIRRAIGSRAEDLAYMFCACDRRHLVSNVKKSDCFELRDRFTERCVSLDRGTLAALIEIALANELEQLPSTSDITGPQRDRWNSYVPFLSVGAREGLQMRLAGL